MKKTVISALCSVLLIFNIDSFAQEESSVSTQLELGAIFTSGNTEDQNVKYNVTLDWDRGNWDYRFSSDGFRSSKEDELAAQRLYHVVSADHTFNADSFIKTRLAYEDDRFSGFESQSDFTVNYGRNLLQSKDNMTLALNFGAGVRRSEIETEDGSEAENEAIVRFEGNYGWNLSETANFLQDFSVESGSNSSIYRLESAIQTDIMDNLSLKFSVKVKHQTDVPISRENTDTETTITLVLNF